MENVNITNKGPMMDTHERYVFRETKLNNQMDDKFTIKHNIIFETKVHEDVDRGAPRYTQSIVI
jgi:hypothetical protein